MTDGREGNRDELTEAYDYEAFLRSFDEELGRAEREQGAISFALIDIDNFKQINPIKHISRISPIPLLLVHGDQDDLVDVSHAHQLYAEAKEPKTLRIISGTGHRLRLNTEAMNMVIEWLKSNYYSTR